VVIVKNLWHTEHTSIEQTGTF